MTAVDVINELATEIRMLAVRRDQDQEALHAVGNAMHKLLEPEAEALIELLDEWAVSR